MARKKKVSNTPAATNIDAYIAGAGKVGIFSLLS